MTRARLAPYAIVAALAALPAIGHAANDNKPFEVQIGGGLVSFPNDVNVNTGGAYGALVGIAPHSPVGLELGYQGAAYTEQPLSQNPSVNNNVAAVENGGYGALKLSPLPGRTFDPYALGGVGVSHLSVRSPQANGALQDDTFGKAPVGVGFDVRLGDFTAGLRGTYNFLFNDQNAFQGQNANSDDQLIGQLNLGAQF
jgi:hypothetical protein